MLKVKALAGKDMIYTFPGNFHRNEEWLKAPHRVKFSRTDTDYIFRTVWRHAAAISGYLRMGLPKRSEEIILKP
ncbi:MAG: hypothetical protein KA801_03095 [Syntrophorhabdaceae bacterium]|nr:hypothetical protein [Syntrophorhabdaceae bacterium]